MMKKTMMTSLNKTRHLNQIGRGAAAMLLATALFGCQDNGDAKLPGGQDRGPQQSPPEGATSFVSADGRNGQATQDDDRNSNNDAGAPSLDADEGAGEPRQAEEGDIYQVIEGSDLVLNLNSYRGLQIIDFSDVTNPKIIGRAQVSGYPVEMYQVDDRVYILLNNWRSYWQSAHDSGNTADTFEGGGVIAVDISNKTAPQITAQARVPGWIQTSRLTRGGGKEALYVVASEYNGGGQTNVKSFSVSNLGKLQEKSTLALGGWVQAIQATGERLMVARYDYNTQRNQGSKVSVIDISSPEGVMVEGAQVQVDGLVQNKHNMNIVGDIMRVVSGNSWAGNTNTNHVETFNIADIQSPVPVDHDTFGAGENLFGTLFMEDRAFFVTYLRQDPFHAFSITPDGQMVEESEFIVSGWNDYFRPVAGGQRLIGIGKNDENGRNTMAVSLYDITNLKNPNPLITRAELALDQSWSEAQWDDRAFSILEKGTNVLAPDGVTREFGLILLPYSGWNNAASTYESGVQIFTFSNNTITRRGKMDHGTPVRRSFQADSAAKIAGNLSETELALFDTNNPDNPVEKGRVELAPYFADFKIFGAYGVRHHDRSNYWGWWGSNAGQREDSLQIVPLIGDVDGAAALAEIPVPAGSKTYKVGDRLVVTSMEYVQPANGQGQGAYETDIAVWNLSNPLNPQPEGTLTTTELQPSYSYGGWWRGEDCFDCRGGGYYGGGQLDVKVVGNAMLFPRQLQKQELQGTAQIRNSYPTDNRYWERCYGPDADGNHTAKACTYNTGYRNCSQLTRVDGTQEAEVCQGAFYTCTQDAQGATDCQEVPVGSIPTQENVYSNEQYRYWTHYELSVLDVTNPAQPTLRPKLTMPEAEEAVALVEDGSGVWVNYKQPTQLPGDSRPYVRYFVKRLELSNPSAPALGAAINVPGELIAAQQDTLLTRDFLWGQSIVETSINKLKLHGGLAYLQATQRFVDQYVQRVVIDGAQLALVSHNTAWQANQSNNGQQEQHKLSILSLAGNTMSLSATAEVDYWADLQSAKNGRALFQVPGGLLVFNVTNAQSPYAQAYFPTRGWPTDLTLHNSDIYFSAGPYGLYKFDLNTDNLTQP
jgi:hypothetical protein